MVSQHLEIIKKTKTRAGAYRVVLVKTMVTKMQLLIRRGEDVLVRRVVDSNKLIAKLGSLKTKSQASAG